MSEFASEWMVSESVFVKTETITLTTFAGKFKKFYGSKMIGENTLLCRYRSGGKRGFCCKNEVNLFLRSIQSIRNNSTVRQK